MKTQWYNIVTEEVRSSDSSTFRCDLPDYGALHALMIKVHVTNGATSGRNVTPMDALDEIIVKSETKDPIFSLTPQELEKWGEVWLGKALPAVHDEQASVVQEMVFPIYFGRELFDREFFMPLSRHKKLELNIKHSFTAAADGGFATGTLTIDVKALITPEEQNLPYSGTLTVRRLYTHTSAASGEKAFEMPGKSVIRAIGLYCYEAGVADDTDISKVTVRNLRDTHNILEQGWDDFIHNSQLTLGGTLERNIVCLAQNDDVLYTRIGEITGVQVSDRRTALVASDIAYAAKVDAIAGDELTFDVVYIEAAAGTEEVAVYATDIIIDVCVKGKYPSYFGVVPFLFPDELSGYWNEEESGNLSVIATQGGADANVHVSLQEVISF
jgi:hypothetical protein